jgi:hypothetical protein
MSNTFNDLCCERMWKVTISNSRRGFGWDGPDVATGPGEQIDFAGDDPLRQVI